MGLITNMGSSLLVLQPPSESQAILELPGPERNASWCPTMEVAGVPSCRLDP